MLYVLCTGFPLFTVDNQENVRPEELQKIAAWGDDEKAHKMAIITKGWPQRLISSLLSRDPQQRPPSWDYVLKQLGVQKSGRAAVNIRACSVYHLTDVLRPACDEALEECLVLGSTKTVSHLKAWTVWKMPRSGANFANCWSLRFTCVQAYGRRLYQRRLRAPYEFVRRCTRP